MLLLLPMIQPLFPVSGFRRPSIFFTSDALKTVLVMLFEFVFFVWLLPLPSC